MYVFRSLAAGAMMVGAVSGCALCGTGAASAVAMQPVGGGVEVNLTHDETLWAHQIRFGNVLAILPSPAAPSFGESLNALTDLASRYPQGRVTFTIVGPLGNPSGTMTALAE